MPFAVVFSYDFGTDRSDLADNCEVRCLPHKLIDFGQHYETSPFCRMHWPPPRTTQSALHSSLRIYWGLDHCGTEIEKSLCVLSLGWRIALKLGIFRDFLWFSQQQLLHTGVLSDDLIEIRTEIAIQKKWVGLKLNVHCKRKRNKQ